MFSIPTFLKWSLFLSFLGVSVSGYGASGDFDTFLKPLFTESCVKCHGEEKVKGKVNLKEINTVADFMAKPELIEVLIEVIDASDMPPEDEPGLKDADRKRLLTTLKSFLKEATAGAEAKPAPIRRLNRFQYNNAVRDLFQLNRDVFPLSEKLMTRHSDYLRSGAKAVPNDVEVASLTLNPQAGLSGVKPFPKDLRAAHGFDNQANQLTLSPLLLDTFLKLSVSIVESPDFKPETVGIWKAFFESPGEGVDVSSEMAGRLKPFLQRAFRTGVDDATVERYAAYGMSRVNQGLAFSDAMKKVASAALSSPMFLYRSGSAGPDEKQFQLASNLSFFFWASGPDQELLRLAEEGVLTEPDTLQKTIDRMMADPKIERFLDTFPSQWMQLENVLAATPDPGLSRYFLLDKQQPASLQMLIEPLLLFDAVFVENRPVIELISPKFGYRSGFLDDWYTSDLQPDPIDEQSIKKENRSRQDHREEIIRKIKNARHERDQLDKDAEDPVGRKRVEVDLKPGQAKWEIAQAELLAQSVEFSSWHRIGPFQAGNFDEAHDKSFFDESAVDLEKKHGNLSWVEAKDYADGKVYEFGGQNCATYIYRTIKSAAARTLEISIGSDDSFKIWLNGKVAAENKVSRGVAPDQDKVQLNLVAGENTFLMKVANGGGGHGFYFKARPNMLPGPIIAAMRVPLAERSIEQAETVARHYRSFAPELAPVRKEIAEKKAEVVGSLARLEEELNRAPKPQELAKHREEAQRRYDDQIRNKMRSKSFRRVELSDPRYGGVITTAAMLSMTSGPKRTHPIARGAWIIEVIFNDPPPPPPNDVPPLNEEASSKELTIREKFAVHRENPDCAGCHSRLDPLGFAMENFDVTGRWRDKYSNGRDVDSSGTLMRKYPFKDVVQFKRSLTQEDRRFARAFTAHLLRFALTKELSPADSLTVEAIVNKAEADGFRLKSLIREVVLSDRFVRKN